MDLRMPVKTGVAAIEAIRRRHPDARIIVLTTFEGDALALQSLRAGAAGYLLKSSQRRELSNAVRHRGAMAFLIAVVLHASIVGQTTTAETPADGFAPYKHMRWTPDDGAPTGLKTMVQAADGYLVLASEFGVYRFDGSRFEPIPDRRPDPLAGTPPSALMRARNGDIWIGYTSRGGVQVPRIA
jgi:CheY-like chemotaxis protein